MKPLYNIFIIACLLLSPEGMRAQFATIDEVLLLIKSNNKELRKNAALADAQKAQISSENNLPDPSLSYAHLWNGREKKESISELVISQSFDFPTVYATRHRMNRFKHNELDADKENFRQQLLLQAKEICFDLLMLQQQQALLEERLRQANVLDTMYRRRLEMGDTGILEVNKIRLELLNARNEARANRTAIEGKWSELTMLNGNIAPGFSVLENPPLPQLPPDYERLHEEVLSGSPSLITLDNRHHAADRQVNLSRQGWLPKMELGYRRNTEAAVPFNGFVVGFSFPLFENRHKVKIAKMQELSTRYEKENEKHRLSNSLERLYREASALQLSIREYQEAFRSQQDLHFLKRALDGGEINLIAYFAETSLYYQSKLNLLQLENEYRKAVARIYRHKL